MLQLINEKKRKFLKNESIYSENHNDDSSSCISSISSYPSHAPLPEPPPLYKYQIYSDPLEFAHVDQIAISVAQENQKTFTDLVRQLVARCESDVEKAR